MLRPYSYWESVDGLEGSFGEGEDFHPQAFVPGTEVIRLYVIDAETFEEAMAVHHLRRGLGPYYPTSDAYQCPNCLNHFYEGSGECFCGFHS